MTCLRGAALAAVISGFAITVQAQQVPETTEQVAQPTDQMAGIPELAVVKVADGFADPTSVVAANDGSGRLFVTERVGRVRVVSPDGTVQEEPFLDLTAMNPLGSIVQTGFVEQGLFSMAFHPDFQENGYVYVHYTSLPFNGDNMIVRFTVDPENPDVITPERANETAKVIMQIDQPWYNHNGGQIAFGPNDGYLYIGIGDGGWEGDPLQAGQDLSTPLGKMLRIDVNVAEDADRPYAIPDDNPFATAADPQLMNLFGITEEQFAEIRTRARPEIWSYGLRNPYSFSFDQQTGDLYIADVGQNHWEEINFQPADSEGGENYGWAEMMGTFCHPLTGELEVVDGRFVPQPDCPIVGVLPAAEYPHEAPYPGAEGEIAEISGCSVQGMGVGTFGDRRVYLAGDWCSGRLFGLSWNEQDGQWNFASLLQTDLQFTSGGVGEDGTVYAVNCNCFYLTERGPLENPPGSLWRIVPAAQVAEGAETARVRAPGEEPAEQQEQAD